MKKIVSEFNFNEQQLNTIKRLSKELQLDEIVVKLLFERGADTKEKILKFLNPSKNNFINPYTLSGMEEVVALIKEVKSTNGKIAVFGDYDADGVCACSIMHFALKNFGVDFYIHIPERSEGYGLCISSIDRIIENEKPDMIITVDCGISNYEEVEYIKSKGLKVAVTDHHELPVRIPDCICVNPKFADDYPYDNLCGAGVAFKLCQALLGDKAYEVLDICSLATVADSVPLLGENRDIVAEGLKMLSIKPRLAFTALLKNATEISSQTLAFTIAPKINAAGRVGSARLAFEFFTEEDEKKILEIANELFELNTQRQQLCDEMYLNAKKKLSLKGAYSRAILLYDTDWSGGFIGIVAARMSEEYNRPVLLFSKKGDMLKGSARSIERVNIYEALVACKDVIEEFGGHSQAAGINIKEENFPLLEERLCNYLENNYTDDVFISQISVCEKIDKPFSIKLANELNQLEPYGVGNKKPLFSLDETFVDAQITKEGSTHVTIKNDLIDMMYFNGIAKLDVLQCGIKKHIVFEYNLSTYKGREYLKGFIKDVLYEEFNENELTAYSIYNNLKNLQNVEKNSISQGKHQGEVDIIIKEALSKSHYGTCLIASDISTLKKYPFLKGLDINLFQLSTKNLNNCILLSPTSEVDLSEYRDIIYLDTPISYVGLKQIDEKNKNCKKVVYNLDICGYNKFYSLNTEREALLEVYAELKKNSYEAQTSLQASFSLKNKNIDACEFIFAIEVFFELGLVIKNKNVLTINKGRKVNLTSSNLYNLISDLKR